MRRLLILASAVVFVEMMFFAAVVPILPDLRAELGLSKSAAGLLSAAYAAGTLAASLPAGMLVARVGSRPTVLAGLSLMSVSSLAFALADDGVALGLARLVQGVGGAASWAGMLAWLLRLAPSERRGELIGRALAAGLAGIVCGPLLGAAAHAFGRGPTFAGVAIAGVALIALTLRVPAVPPTAARAVPMLRVGLREPRVRLGIWLILVPGLLFSSFGVLVPLRMDELGAGATAIALTFVAAGVVEVVMAPVAGRISDRRGRLAPSVAGMVACTVLTIAIAFPDTVWLLAAGVVAATPAMGLVSLPAMAMLSDGADSAGVDQGLAFGFVNLGWALGHTLGGIGGPAMAEAVDDAFAYFVLAAVCLGTLVVLRSWTRAGAVPRSAPGYHPLG